MAKKSTIKPTQKAIKPAQGAMKQGMPMMPPIGKSAGGSGGMPNGKTQSLPIPSKGKKPALKIDIMLAKAMPGIGPKGMPPKKGSEIPMAKKGAPKSGKKGGKGGKPC